MMGLVQLLWNACISALVIKCMYKCNVMKCLHKCIRYMHECNYYEIYVHDVMQKDGINMKNNDVANACYVMCYKRS